MSKGYHKIDVKKFALSLTGIREAIGYQQNLEGISFTKLLDTMEAEEKDLREQKLDTLADTSKVLRQVITEMRVYRAKVRDILAAAPHVTVEHVTGDKGDEQEGPH